MEMNNPNEIESIVAFKLKAVEVRIEKIHDLLAESRSQKNPAVWDSLIAQSPVVDDIHGRLKGMILNLEWILGGKRGWESRKIEPQLGCGDG